MANDEHVALLKQDVAAWNVASREPRYPSGPRRGGLPRGEPRRGGP